MLRELTLRQVIAELWLGCAYAAPIRTHPYSLNAPDSRVRATRLIFHPMRGRVCCTLFRVRVVGGGGGGNGGVGGGGGGRWRN